MATTHPDSFKARATIDVGGTKYEIFRLDALQGVGDVATLPYSIKVLLENLLRLEDGKNVTRQHVEAVAKYDPKKVGETEFAYTPARVLLQDFTGVPCVVDLASMREGLAAMGGDPAKTNPLQPVDRGNRRWRTRTTGCRRPPTSSSRVSCSRTPCWCR